MYRIIFLSLGMLASLAAQETLSLSGAFDAALENNFSIKIARNETEISANNASPGKAGLLPTLSANGAVLNNNIDNAVTGKSNSTRTSTGLSLSYTLFSGLSRWYGYQGLKEQQKFSSLRERQTIEHSLLSVAQAYFNLAAASENLEILSDQIQVSRERRNLAQERRELGSLGRIDFLNAQVDFNSDSLNYLSARQSEDDARRRLNVLLGWTPDKVYAVQQDNSSFTDYNREELVSLARENNSSYLIAESSREQSELSLKVTRSSLLPQISYSASLGYDQTAVDWGIGLDNPNSGLTHNISLGWNLFSGGSRSANIQNARISVRNAELRQEKAGLELSSSLETAISSYENSLAILEGQEQNLEFARLNFERSQELYRLGQISSLQFREAQLALSRSLAGITTSRYSARAAELELLRLSGRLSG